MSDLRDAAALVTSLKGAFELTKAFMDVRGAVQVQGKVFELQGVILAAQESALAAQGAQSDLLSRIDKFEKRIAELEAWDSEKERYQPTELTRGVFAYTLKPETKGTDPDMPLCAHCFHEGHKSVLQTEVRMPGRTTVAVCNRCGANLYVLGPRYADQPQPGPRHSPKR